MELNVVITIIIIMAVFYVLTLRDSDPSEDLYHSLLFDGCSHCNGSLAIVHVHPTDDKAPMVLECTLCDRRYEIDHITRRARKL